MKKLSLPRLPSIFVAEEFEKLPGFKGQDFYELQQECLNSKKLFEDPEFEASDKNLFYDNDTPKSYTWLRPLEICSNPQFVTDTFSRFDVKQGNLGNCWFVSAVATLTLHQKFLNRVVCRDNSFEEGSYAGIFHFRFWHFGEWVDVVIDDRLPTFNKQLVYIHSRKKDEYWSALLEKAYAKLKGGYQNLDGGESSVAFQNFSGGITESFKLDQTPEKIINKLKTSLRKSSMQDVGSKSIGKSNQNSFQLIFFFFPPTGTLIGCGIDSRGSDNESDELEDQLPSEHAYSITRLSCVNNTQLLRLRNPYGNRMKWKGAWSDNSKEWDSVPEDIKRRMSLRRTSDGEFWMSYEDFTKLFSVIEVCNFSPEDAIEEEDNEEEPQHDGKWYKANAKSKWIAGVNSGGFKNVEINPQFLMTLEAPSDGGKCSIVVTLMQHSDGLAISFFVYHVDNEKNLADVPMKNEFFKNAKREEKRKVSYSREVKCSFKLSPGKYLIVPFNRTCESGEFLIRVFADTKCELKFWGNEKSS